MATVDVIWMRSANSPKLHAVDADTKVPRGGNLAMPTVCRPSAVTHLLPPDNGLEHGLAKCKACLNRLPASGAHLTPRQDPPPANATRSPLAGAAGRAGAAS